MAASRGSDQARRDAPQRGMWGVYVLALSGMSILDLPLFLSFSFSSSSSLHFLTIGVIYILYSVALFTSPIVPCNSPPLPSLPVPEGPLSINDVLAKAEHFHSGFVKNGQN